MKVIVKKILSDLFEKWTKESPTRIKQFPESGSNRTYYRIYGDTKTAIGVFNPDRKENEAFIAFSEHFYNQN